MFRVVCYCEDKDLGRVKSNLVQMGIKHVEDQPVANGRKLNGRVVASASGSALRERVLSELMKTHKGKVIPLDVIRAICARQGAPQRQAASNVAFALKSAKLLKRVGGVGQAKYELVVPKSKYKAQSNGAAK